jgi:hypothetical protein
VLHDFLVLFQWASDIVGNSMRHGCDMADNKIDPALVQLTPTRPLEAFQQNGDPGYVVVWTSTCSTAPARIPFHSPQQWTPMLRTAIAEEYARQLQAGSTARYDPKEIVGRIGDLSAEAGPRSRT